MKNFLIILVVLVVIGGGGVFAWKKWQEKERVSAKSTRVTTAIVQARDVQFKIDSAGEIGPADQVSVRPEVNGKIAELPVDIGDNVKKGDLLFSLDDADLQIEKSSRLTEIEGAKLQLDRSKRNFERTEKLFLEKFLSREIYDNAKTDFDLSKNALERTDKELRLVEDRLSKTKILSPFDCTVLTRPVSVGQAVSGSGGFNSGTEVMSIANLNEMIITSHISQTDVTRIKIGQKVAIEIESVPGLKMSGVMERIAPQATIKNNLKGFSVRVAIKKIDPRVRPGMTANLSIPVASADNVLCIPLAAVFTEDNERYALVKTGETYERRPIQIGVTDYSFAEVITGLSAGETVSLEQPSEDIKPADGVAAPDKKKAAGGSKKRRNGTNGVAKPGATNDSKPAAKP